MKSNNKIYIILSIFASASLILAVFFIWPVLEEIGNNSKDLISEKNNLVTLAAQNNETDNFRKNYETYRPNLEKIDQLFIDPTNPVDFIKFLEDTATSSQITSQISLQPIPQGLHQSSQNFIIFQFSSDGSFSEMLNFAEKIEAGPYLIEIENLTIQTSEGPAGASPENIYNDYSSRKVDATFAIKAFIKK